MSISSKEQPSFFLIASIMNSRMYFDLQYWNWNGYRMNSVKWYISFIFVILMVAEIKKAARKYWKARPETSMARHRPNHDNGSRA